MKNIIKKQEKSINEIIDIINIDENGVWLRNEKLIKILKVEPINFKLKSQVEQEAILESYKYFLKQCNFDFQIFIQTRKVNAKKHVEEIEKCILYESEISDMAKDYIELIKELLEVRGSISRRFFIVIETNKNDNENKILKVKEGLRGCGNIVKECRSEEILEIFRSCFKTTF